MGHLFRQVTKLAFLFLMLGPSASFATDGVILIDQSKALAGNVTPGNAAGFPVTISRRGSYKLSGPLVAPAHTPGIVITASPVSLDLNGFSLSGNTGCCATTGISGGSKISVSNGFVTGFAIGIYMGSSVTVENMLVETTGSGALFVGSGSVVRGNIFQTTPAFQITCPSVVVDNFFSAAGNNGSPTGTCANANNVNF